jgi:hypothetical protein
MGRGCLLLLSLIIVGPLSAEMDDAALLKAFEMHVSSLTGLDGSQRQIIKEAIAEYGTESVGDAITEALIAIFPHYDAAIETTDGENLDAMVTRLTPFSQSDDPFLAADASFYLARALMNHENFEAAFPLLEAIAGNLSDYTVHVGEARFYLGVSQAGLLKYAEAIQTLTDFLQSYPEAPERLRIAAWRQVQQLRTIENGKMEDIYHRMDFSRRQLSLIEPGEVTQAEQKNILNMLAKLIREQQKKEASSSSSQQNTQQQQQQQQQQAQNQQKQQNQSSRGGSSNNPNGQAVRKAYDDGPASPWSRLRDRSRDPANNAIKDKLPARYRDIVERYYEAANGGSNR